jgi:peptidoglycan hydrolase CwlO-like protein
MIAYKTGIHIGSNNVTNNIESLQESVDILNKKVFEISINTDVLQNQVDFYKKHIDENIILMSERNEKLQDAVEQGFDIVQKRFD